MKTPRFFTLLFTICLLISLSSCSDDTDTDENFLYIKGLNIEITHILITSGDEVLIDKSESNTTPMTMSFEKHKNLKVKATARVSYNIIGYDKMVYFMIAKKKGDKVKILEEFEEENLPEGEEITLTATVTF